MGVEESEKEEDMDALFPSLAGVKLVDAPILFFVSSRKVFKRELEELHRIVLEAADSLQRSSIGEFVDNFCWRLEFFKIVYKYHSAAEDEYMCGIPVVLLEDFLQWMADSLPPDAQIDLLQCMKVVIRKKELFQEWSNLHFDPAACMAKKPYSMVEKSVSRKYLICILEYFILEKTKDQRKPIQPAGLTDEIHLIAFVFGTLPFKEV